MKSGFHFLSSYYVTFYSIYIPSNYICILESPLKSAHLHPYFGYMFQANVGDKMIWSSPQNQDVTRRVCSLTRTFITEVTEGD